MTQPNKTCRLVWRNPDTGVDDPVIGTADYIPGTALASTYEELPDGSLEPIYEGETDVDWDGQFNMGEASGIKPYHHFAVCTESGEIVDIADCIRIAVSSEHASAGEPHAIPNRKAKIEELTASITRYITETEVEDLIQRCVEETWTLDQAREHVAFQALELEWYQKPTDFPNPEQYVLATLKGCADETDYDQFDPSLKINEGT